MSLYFHVVWSWLEACLFLPLKILLVLIQEFHEELELLLTLESIENVGGVVKEAECCLFLDSC